MKEDTLKKILNIGLIYLIGSFIGESWDPMSWHWAIKVLAVIFVLGNTPTGS